MMFTIRTYSVSFVINHQLIIRLISSIMIYIFDNVHSIISMLVNKSRTEVYYFGWIQPQVLHLNLIILFVLLFMPYIHVEGF